MQVCSKGWCINGTCCGQASPTSATLSPTFGSNVTETPWQTLINNITMATQTPSSKCSVENERNPKFF